MYCEISYGSHNVCKSFDLWLFDSLCLHMTFSFSTFTPFLCYSAHQYVCVNTHFTITAVTEGPVLHAKLTLVLEKGFFTFQTTIEMPRLCLCDDLYV